MEIGKRYKIESDSMNITLYRINVTKKTNKEYWVAEGYYNSVQNALKALVDKELAGTGLNDLKTVSRKQDELYKMIDTLTKSLVVGKKAK